MFWFHYLIFFWKKNYICIVFCSIIKVSLSQLQTLRWFSQITFCTLYEYCFSVGDFFWLPQNIFHTSLAKTWIYSASRRTENGLSNTVQMLLNNLSYSHVSSIQYAIQSRNWGQVIKLPPVIPKKANPKLQLGIKTQNKEKWLHWHCFYYYSLNPNLCLYAMCLWYSSCNT